MFKGDILGTIQNSWEGEEHETKKYAGRNRDNQTDTQGAKTIEFVQPDGSMAVNNIFFSGEYLIVCVIFHENGI